MSKKGKRIFTLARDCLVILAVTIVMFVAAEFAIKLLAPQDVVTTFVDDISIAVVDDDLGHVYRPNSHAIVKTPEFSVEYKINQHGLGDESFHPDPKPSDVTRILLLGDSFTFGDANAYDKIWPVVFERTLLGKSYKVDVVKAGVSGYDTQKEVLYLKRLFPEYDPDIVVLTFLPNDLFINKPLPDQKSPETSPRADANDIVVRARGDKQAKLQIITFAKRLLLRKDFLYARLNAMTARSEYFTMPMSARLVRQVAVTMDI